MRASTLCRSLRSRTGVALLEAIVALAVLGVVGSAGAMTAFELTRTVARVQEAEAMTRSAARLLTAVSLWPREDLDRHLGSTAQGPMTMWVDRIEPTLYWVTLTEAATERRLLQTTLFRPITGR